MAVRFPAACFEQFFLAGRLIGWYKPVHPKGLSARTSLGIRKGTTSPLGGNAMSHLTRLFNPCSVASIVAVGFLISPHHALAIAPSQQQTNPAAGTTLNSVVRMVANATTGVGTGSIIDTSLGGFGSGYFFVLTADHNFPVPRESLSEPTLADRSIRSTTS